MPSPRSVNGTRSSIASLAPLVLVDPRDLSFTDQWTNSTLGDSFELRAGVLVSMVGYDEYLVVFFEESHLAIAKF